MLNSLFRAGICVRVFATKFISCSPWSTTFRTFGTEWLCAEACVRVDVSITRSLLPGWLARTFPSGRSATLLMHSDLMSQVNARGVAVRDDPSKFFQ